MARLADTDLDVFPLCLGGNVFGWTIDERALLRGARRLLSRRAGTSSTPPTSTADAGPKDRRSSERIIGRWIAARGNRDELVIATKVGMSPEHPGPLRRGHPQRHRRVAERLGIDAIDLYYAHRDDPDTPLEETLGAFRELIEEGKIRYAAASNYSAERLEQALSIGERDGRPPMSRCSPTTTCMERGEYEGAARRLCERQGLACMPYFGSRSRLSDRQVPARGERKWTAPRRRRAREILQRARLRGARRAR